MCLLAIFLVVDWDNTEFKQGFDIWANINHIPHFYRNEGEECSLIGSTQLLVISVEDAIWNWNKCYMMLSGIVHDFLFIFHFLNEMDSFGFLFRSFYPFIILWVLCKDFSRWPKFTF